jgi:hypothetical protein
MRTPGETLSIDPFFTAVPKVGKELSCEMNEFLCTGEVEGEGIPESG